MVMQLAAADLGIGSCHAGVADLALARELLGFPADRDWAFAGRSTRPPCTPWPEAATSSAPAGAVTRTLPCSRPCRPSRSADRCPWSTWTSWAPTR
ncbi:MAG: hypothetical protein ACRDRJ_42920 [Streptosporangiaceae bacterium]